MIEYTFPRGMQDLREGDVPRIGELLTVLTQRNVRCDREALATVFSRAQLLLARDISVEGAAPIVGLATMNLITTLVKSSGYINDVVVLPSHEGRGIGTELVHRLIEQARNLGLKHVQLTSRRTEQRARAHHVYGIKLKGELLDTNVYRWTFWRDDEHAG